MLKREWGVTQSQIADSVRNNVRVKNQRIATVNNLGKATKLEEAMESASRKLRRLITFQKPVSKQVKDLEAKVNEAVRLKSQLKLELNMAGEYSDGSGSDTREETPEALDISASSL
jgi:phage shock protein A